MKPVLNLIKKLPVMLSLLTTASISCPIPVQASESFVRRPLVEEVPDLLTQNLQELFLNDFESMPSFDEVPVSSEEHPLEFPSQNSGEDSLNDANESAGEEEANKIPETSSGPWFQLPDNTWQYQLDDGTLARNTLMKIDGSSYLFDENGTMLTGFQNWEGVQYYFDASGAQKSGWLHAPDTFWYYCTSNGLKTGWLKDLASQSYYHFDEKGRMSVSEWIPYEEQSFYCDSAGAMIENRWATIQGIYYWFDESGASVPSNVNGIALINKKHPLPESFAPTESPAAADAVHRMIADMQLQGLNIGNSYSGYRSYEVQKQLYAGYVFQDGQQIADTYSARPGYSEHQSGLAFDLMHTSGALVTNPREARWIEDHAHEYGFIVRYKEGWEDITGYMAEPWHVRYIGAEAEAIKASGLPLESYLHQEGGDYYR